MFSSTPSPFASRRELSRASAADSQSADASARISDAMATSASRYAPACSPAAFNKSCAARTNPSGRLLPLRTNARSFASRAAASQDAFARASPAPVARTKSDQAFPKPPPPSSGATTACTSGAISIGSSLPIHASAAARRGACLPLRFFRRGRRHRTTRLANAGLCSAVTHACAPPPAGPGPPSASSVRRRLISSSFMVFSSATRAKRSAFSGDKCGKRHCPRHFIAHDAKSLSSALTCRSRDARTPSPTPCSSAFTARPPPSAF